MSNMAHNKNNLVVNAMEEVNLQEIIKVRKMERKLMAEERRQLDLQRIREMKSTTGIDPVELFPKEIWERILDELDPLDRGNASLVHQLFHDLTKSSRVRDILLPQILRLPAFREYCNSKGVRLSLDERLISKTTRKYFDQCKKDTMLRQVTSVKEAGTWRIYTVNLNLLPEGRETLSSLLASFRGNNPGKSFFPRELNIFFSELAYESEELDDEIRAQLHNQFKQDVTSLLTIIGNQILHFTFYAMQADMLIDEIYELFKDWTSLMPNIIWLEFCIPIAHPLIVETWEGVEVGFPRLSSLQRLSLHFCHVPVRMGIYEAVIAANQHVKILDFCSPVDYFLALDSVPVHLIQRMPLTSVLVYIKDQPQGLRLEAFESVVNFNWPLKAVMLQLNVASGESGMSSVFRFLERFPTLETVKLTGIHGLIIGNTDSWGYLELPNLSSLTLNMENPEIEYGTNIHFFLSLQFLLRCGKLKTLNWKLGGVDDSQLRRNLKRFEDRKTMDFRAGIRFVYESMIWDAFPLLDSVVVNVRKRRLDDDTGEEINYRFACGHAYFRAQAKEGMSQFVKKHSCSLLQDGLLNCVVFVD